MTDDSVKLIARTITGKDSQMRTIYSETVSEILASSEPISRSEFFSAGQLGIDPQFMLVINPAEYTGQKIVEYRGKRMSIYRTYERSENELEIYLQKAEGLNGGANT